MPAAFFTGQPGPDAIAKMNQLWLAFVAGGTGGGTGGTVDMSALNAAVAAANASATAAANSATAAANSATGVATSATTATNAATAAGTSATTATNAATAAGNSATAAGTSATASATSATTSTNAATSTATSVTAAGTSATNAANSATAAANSATAAANSAAAAAVSAGTTPPASAPPAPANLVASGPTGNSLTLTWNAAATATGYNVYRDGAKLNTSPLTGLSYNATGLTPSTQYTWTVKAVNAAGESAGAVALGTTTTLALPAAPTGLAASAAKADSMALNWNAVSGAVEYNLYRGATKANAAPIYGLAFTDYGLNASTAYTWTVKALNSVGEGPASAVANGVTTGAAINGLTPLGTRLMGGYFEAYNPQYNITATPLRYGLIFLFNAQPWAPGVTGNLRDNIGDGTFSLRDAGQAQINPDSIQTVRARGQKVVVSFGGANAGYNFDTRAKSNNFIASVKAILAALQTPANGAAWGADGIDLNMYEAFVRDLSKSNPGATVNFVSEVTYICQQLRAYYGANFIITTPPVPDAFRTPNFAPLDAPLAKSLSDNNLLSVVSPQYYGIPNFKSYHDQWVTLLSNRQQQVGMGLSILRAAGEPTFAECKAEVSAILTQYPNTRMVYGWTVQDDLNGGGAWGSEIAALIGVGTVVPPAEVPVTPPTEDVSSIVNALAFEGGKNGGWIDAAPANLRQGVTKASATVTTTGQTVGRIVDRSANDNDPFVPAGGPNGCTYRLLAGKHDLGFLFDSRLASSTGGGSGQQAATVGFAASFVVAPGGYYNCFWSDRLATDAFKGRECLWDSDEGGFVFSVGTGTARVRAVVGGLRAFYSAPDGTVAYNVDVLHEGTTISIRVNGGAAAVAACPTFAVGDVNYSVGGRNETYTDAIGRVGYAAWMFSPLTLALRNAMSTFVATKKRVTAAPPTTAPTIAIEADSKTNLLQVGDPASAYWLHNNRWGQGSITEGPDAATQFMQEMGRLTGVGPAGEVGARIQWRWPDPAPAGSMEVKGYPSIGSGRIPGWYTPDSYIPAYDKPVKLPDGSILQTIPAGATPGTFFPMQLPVSSLKATASWAFPNGAPTGKGQLTYDIWMQSIATQTSGGMASSPITHEIMIPLTNWGGYGGHNIPGGRSPASYSHDVTLGGILFHVYASKNADGTLTYTFGNLNNAYGKLGWKMIAFVPDMPILSGQVDLAAIINHVATRVDSAGTPWAVGNEYVVSCELGVEPETGSGDLTIYNYKVGQTL